jgi:translation elongation factor EF-G
MDVEVTVPSEYQAGIMGQLVKRRAASPTPKQNPEFLS